MFINVFRINVSVNLQVNWGHWVSTVPNFGVVDGT